MDNDDFDDMLKEIPPPGWISTLREMGWRIPTETAAKPEREPLTFQTDTGGINHGKGIPADTPIAGSFETDRVVSKHHLRPHQEGHFPEVHQFGAALRGVDRERS
jgi:hypothetical protein